MDARDKILNAVEINQPDWVDLPIIDLDMVIDYEDVYIQFKKILESIGGKVIAIENSIPLKEELVRERATGKFVINTITELEEVNEQEFSWNSFELEELEKVYIKGNLGVAENGAVWIAESQMKNRLLPFICQHLVLLINKKDIVATMHQAYKKIDVSKEGFGVFIAGPSKTADIEQSLVIGAHGARTTTVYIIE